ncbi:MAG: hypothetical protein WCA84_06175 [Ignavibacteriaceae bacterium]
MNMHDLKWSPAEKKIARTAFDKAYSREILDIKKNLIAKVKTIKYEKDIWALHDYLSDRRITVDNKYDYRYSKLIIVFSRLLIDGYLKKEELTGLREDKIDLILKICFIEKNEIQSSLN